MKFEKFKSFLKSLKPNDLANLLCDLSKDQTIFLSLNHWNLLLYDNQNQCYFETKDDFYEFNLDSGDLVNIDITANQVRIQIIDFLDGSIIYEKAFPIDYANIINSPFFTLLNLEVIHKNIYSIPTHILSNKKFKKLLMNQI